MASDANLAPAGRMTPYTARPFPTTEGAVARRAFVWSTIGSKVVLAVTGVALALFLPVHLLGNFLLFSGAAAFNQYSHKLTSIPVLVPIIEMGLVALFVIHSTRAVATYLRNRGARGNGYAVKRWAGGRSRKSWASTTMIISGLTLAVFVPVHLLQFKYGSYYDTVIDGVPVRDIYRTVYELFQNPLIVVFYLLCMTIVGSHLYHGFASAFQSLGVTHPRYARPVLNFGRLFAVVIGGGFFILPLYMFFLA